MQLPTEIWCLVLTHVDDFSLWVICRAVSKALRTEAELEFVRERIQHVEIRWNSNGATKMLSLREINYIVVVRTGGLLSISPDGLRSIFSIKRPHEPTHGRDG